ncbi:DUF3307 domain-containing protein [Streptomyces sp. NBC_01433]|uniref:DUF3307 domain-containing protein n=1 Tax=Streptomyces sp. NBC_01433 TaxID=2903864 RepID=UPI002258B7F7|nr:DUF3307 domain-containing protein [Streptomyces sp. NBC_01433]MCX4681303.1 DUF3307 domain-containing protein [Streptomyces sp. NBC_01433]MCX4682380.1 DUF3307 domain-containing protein [Streptomyces sp. NBC_01433]
MFATLFILLYAAHLVSDYALQTDTQAEHKALRSAAGWRALLSHAGTHVVASAVALGAGAVLLDLPLTLPVAGGVLAWVGLSHGFVDRRWPVQWWMEHTGSTDFFQKGGAPLVDQTAHVTALLLAALVAAA